MTNYLVSAYRANFYIIVKSVMIMDAVSATMVDYLAMEYADLMFTY